MKILSVLVVVVVTTVQVVTNANASELPFLETFEVSDGVTNGTINGQNGWVLESGTAEVQSGVSQVGSQALQIFDGQASHMLSSDSSALWAYFDVFCQASDAISSPDVEENTCLIFYINTNQHVVVYSNMVPVELDAQVPLNEWVRFDIYCDYDDQYWDLGLNGINVAAGLPLYSTNYPASALSIGNGCSSSSVYVDQVGVAETEQTAVGLPDTDSDGIPDWWEQKHSGGITSVVAGNPSGNDGLTYLQTYIAGVSPDFFDPFLVSPVSDGYGLAWEPVESRWYSVYWTPSLTNEFTLLQGGLQYPQSQFVDLMHSNEDAGFYRLRVEVQ